VKVILTLDYELFFGSKVGTPQKTIIAASNKLLKVLKRHDAKAVFFVDATYLARLKELKKDSPALQQDYDDVTGHIGFLESEGHQIQLHIHPHWSDCHYGQGEWDMNLKRYRLIDWSKSEADKIISSSVAELNQHVENKVFAFRAGGWCIQPFTHISEALINHGIYLDSTVFRHGRALSETHAFDFTTAPDLTHWMFESDPCEPNETGPFKEISISSMRVSPLFFWRLAYVKLFADKLLHRSFGDGVPVSHSRKDMLRMLTCYSHSTVSADGYKSSCLIPAYKKAKNRGDDYLVVIGHPKALSNYSLRNLDKWLSVLTKEHNRLQIF